MFISALFTITKLCDQSACPSIYEWIKKMWYVYTKEHYSDITEQNYDIFRKMNGTGDNHSQ
jgi:hypothetical protein